MAEAFEGEGASSPRDIRRNGDLKIDMGRICCVRRVVNLRWLKEMKDFAVGATRVHWAVHRLRGLGLHGYRSGYDDWKWNETVRLVKEYLICIGELAVLK